MSNRTLRSIGFAMLGLGAVLLLTGCVGQPGGDGLDGGGGGSRQVTLSWTAPGDDGTTGQATRYDIRYSTQPITEANWQAATAIAEVPLPMFAGGRQTFTVHDVPSATTYYVALKTVDEAGNWSGLSNVASTLTGCQEDWTCTAYGACTDGVRTRTCTDRASCGTTASKPAERESCTADGEGDGGTGGGAPETIEQTPFLPDSFIAVAARSGEEPLVKLFNGEGTPLSEFLAFEPAYRGGVAVTVADLGSDGITEIIATPTGDHEPDVKVFSQNGDLLAQFQAYPESYRGGLTATVGDLDGGAAEIVTAPLSGGPNVRIFGWRGTRYQPTIENFFAYPRSFRGGVSVAVVDFEGDGKGEIVTAPSSGRFPVRIWGRRTDRFRETTPGFYPYGTRFSGGVTLAAGDLDADGKDELFTAPAGKGGPQVRVFGWHTNRISSLAPGAFVFHRDFRGGLSIAAADLTGDGRAEVAAGIRTGERSLVRVLSSDFRTIFGEFTALPDDRRMGITVGAGR